MATCSVALQSSIGTCSSGRDAKETAIYRSTATSMPPLSPAGAAIGDGRRPPATEHHDGPLDTVVAHLAAAVRGQAATVVIGDAADADRVREALAGAGLADVAFFDRDAPASPGPVATGGHTDDPGSRDGLDATSAQVVQQVLGWTDRLDRAEATLARIREANDGLMDRLRASQASERELRERIRGLRRRLADARAARETTG